MYFFFFVISPVSFHPPFVLRQFAQSSVKEELEHFAETTSLVGLAHVVGDRFRWSKIVWTLAFLGALSAALYQVSYLIMKYRR